MRLNMRVKSKQRIRRLRLELLETRSLLSAAPWSTFEHDLPLGRGLGTEIEATRSFHHSMLEGNRPHGGPSQAAGSRPSRGEAAPIRVSSAADRPAKHGNGFGSRSVGFQSRFVPPPASTIDVVFDNQADRGTLPVQPTETRFATIPREPTPRNETTSPIAQPLENATVLVVRLVPTTLVFTRIVDTPASNTRVDTVEAEAASSRDDVVRVNASPLRQLGAVPADAISTFGSAEANALFGLAQNQSDIPLADAYSGNWPSVDFRFDAFASGIESRTGGYTLPKQDRASFESAWLHLFSESSKQEQVAELDELLESLAQEDAAERGFVTPSLTEDDPKWEFDNSLHPAERAAIVEHLFDREEMDGMIAMELPGDLLIRKNELLDREPGSAAWTTRFGMYRPQGMAAAHGGTAVVATPVNATRATAISENELQADEALLSRFRPVIAATSAAFGAIFIGLRKQRRKLRDQRLNSQKLT